MYQGTAPTLILPVEGIDLTAHTVQVAFRPAAGEVIIKSTPGISIIYEDGDSYIFIPFSQAETLVFPEGVCRVEIRSVNQQGVPFISEVAYMDVVGSMTHNIIEYQGGDNT